MERVAAVVADDLKSGSLWQCSVILESCADMKVLERRAYIVLLWMGHIAG